jgi:hypothetical protein
VKDFAFGHAGTFRDFSVQSNIAVVTKNANSDIVVLSATAAGLNTTWHALTNASRVAVGEYCH